MGGRASRQKGMRCEYAVRDHFRQLGWEAHRVPASGAAQGFKGDVRIIKGDKTLFAEVKVRQNEFKSIYALFSHFGGVVCHLSFHGVLAILSSDFSHLGYGDSGCDGISFEATIPAEVEKAVKKLFTLKEVVKSCDFLVLKIDRHPLLFVRYL